MKLKELIERFFAEMLSQFRNLSEDDLRKIDAGTHEFSLTVKRKKSASNTLRSISASDKKKIMERLEMCRSREDGLAYISSVLNGRDELVQFAKFIEVAVVKEDKIEQIKKKIVEATIGAVLRSNAIQGKKH